MTEIEIASAALADAHADQDKRYCLVVFDKSKSSQELYSDMPPATLAAQFRALAARLDRGQVTTAVAKGEPGDPS